MSASTQWKPSEMSDEEFVNKVNSIRSVNLSDADVASIIGVNLSTYYERLLRYYRSILNE